MAGIVDYGFYIPTNRITVKDIALRWGKSSDNVEESLKISEKAVADHDEDMVTMAYQAGEMALNKFDPLEKNSVGAVFVGSETFPYAVKPHSTIIASFLGIEKNYLALDTQFACKAATGAMLAGNALVKGDDIKYALIIASDKANARPGDALEYSAGSGANAFVLGKKNVLAHILDWVSFSSDTPDFWRRSKANFPSHAGRFTGTPSYFHHIISASQGLLKKVNLKPSDFKFAVFHMPNGSFPIKVAKILGFESHQITPSYVVSRLGNSYSASALMGLVAVLDKSKPGDKIFFASYGSGAGSDAIVFEVTDEILKKEKKFEKMMNEKRYINYSEYERCMGLA